MLPHRFFNSRSRSLQNRLSSLKNSHGSSSRTHSKFGRRHAYSTRSSSTHLIRSTSSSYRGYSSWFLVAPLLGAAAIAFQGENDVEETVLEPNTGFYVKKEIWDGTQELVGTSSRKVTILRFLTYALCFYVDKEKLQREIKALEVADDEQKDTLLSYLIRDPSNFTLCIVPYREIDIQHFTRSFTEGLTPRLVEYEVKREKTPEEARASAKELAKEFIACFQKPRIKPEQRVDFKFEKRNGKRVLEIYIDGQTEGAIENDDIVVAFAQMFLGKDAKTMNMMQDIEAALQKRIE